jgi:hypothetical protein
LPLAHAVAVLIEHLWAAESGQPSVKWALQAMATLLHNVRHRHVCICTVSGGTAERIFGEFDRMQYECCFTVPGTQTTTLDVFKSHNSAQDFYVVAVLHPREQLALARHFPKLAPWQAHLPPV